mgnify:CR=1 FL=1|jgi:hypothetical protein|tara:strand:+ start:66 stop:377 length:312 start_codon:yes stop_codon:yes gene_type:complete
MNPADQQYYHSVTQTMPEMNTLYTMIMDLGIPACVIVASFWFIKYTTDQARKEREEFWKKDAENDAKIMSMVEKSSDAILSIKIALEQNTAAIKELTKNGRNN